MRKVWTYAPHSGGVKIKPAEQGRIRERILAYANKRYGGKFTRLDIRFHGALVYIDANVEPDPPSKKLLQLRGETKEQYLEFQIVKEGGPRAHLIPTRGRSCNSRELAAAPAPAEITPQERHGLAAAFQQGPKALKPLKNPGGSATSCAAALAIAASLFSSAHSSLGQWQALGPDAIPQFQYGPPFAREPGDFTPGPATRRSAGETGLRGSGELGCFAFDPTNPQVMYAACGPGPFSQAGVFKSTDGGNTWSSANAGLTDTATEALWLDETNPNILLVGTAFDGIFRSSDAAGHWIQVTNLGGTVVFVRAAETLYAATHNGVAASTDSGATWSLVEPTSEWVEGLAASGTALYASLADGDVLYQESPSSSWQLVLSDPGHGGGCLAIDPTSPQTVYAVEWDDYYPDFFVTHDGGSTWTQLYPEGSSTSQFHNAAQVVAVDSAGTAYAGFDEGIYVSTNQGTSWVAVPGTAWDIRLIMPWPGQSGKLVVGSDQGLYMTTDGGQTWRGLSGNIRSSLITGLAVSGSSILTAVQDYGPLASYDGGASWQQIPGSYNFEDGSVCFNPGNPSYAYATTYYGFLYSTDGARTFNSVPAIHSFVATQPGGHNMICVDPVNPATVYVAATNGVFKSSNWGVTWNQLSWPFIITSLIVVSPADSQTIFLGTILTPAQDLYVTHDGGTTWTQCSGVLGPPSALDIDPENPGIIELGTWEIGGVFLSTNGGSSFTSYTNGLDLAYPEEYLIWPRISALSFLPGSTNGTAAVATLNGIYLSATPGAPWTNITANAIPTIFTDLAWVGSDLYAATFGEGVLRLANAGSLFLGAGSLQVSISPPGAVSAGAQWQADGGPWQGSGITLSNLITGSHTVAFSTIAGWTPPPSQTVTVKAYQTSTATGAYTQQFGALEGVLFPPGAVTAGAAWQVDGGGWQSNLATVSGLTVGNHTVTFSTVAGWITPAAQTTVAVGANQTAIAIGTYIILPHAAQATAVVSNGVVVAATITDPGYGYTIGPAIYFIGGGGRGAQATVTVSNGVVTAINIVNSGSGYTAAPSIVISPPFLPRLGIAGAVDVTFTNLTIRDFYIMQVMQSGTWTNTGSPFLATADVYSQFEDAGAYQLLALLTGQGIAPAITGAIRLDYGNLDTNLSYQLQTSPNLNTWANVGPPFVAATSTNSLYLDTQTGNRFFRLLYVP